MATIYCHSNVVVNLWILYVVSIATEYIVHSAPLNGTTNFNDSSTYNGYNTTQNSSEILNNETVTIATKNSVQNGGLNKTNNYEKLNSSKLDELMAYSVSNETINVTSNNESISDEVNITSKMTESVTHSTTMVPTTTEVNMATTHDTKSAIATMHNNRSPIATKYDNSSAIATTYNSPVGSSNDTVTVEYLEYTSLADNITMATEPVAMAATNDTNFNLVNHTLELLSTVIEVFNKTLHGENTNQELTNIEPNFTTTSKVVTDNDNIKNGESTTVTIATNKITPVAMESSSLHNNKDDLASDLVTGSKENNIEDNGDDKTNDNTVGKIKNVGQNNEISSKKSLKNKSMQPSKKENQILVDEKQADDFDYYYNDDDDDNNNDDYYLMRYLQSFKGPWKAGELEDMWKHARLSQGKFTKTKL